MGAREQDERPGARSFGRRCRGRYGPASLVRGSATDPLRAELARQFLVLKLQRRRRWALHRHVHLHAAFEDAASREPVRSVLSVGCGSATSELLLAVDHPDVTFTVTDHDAAVLERPRALIERFGLTNVEVRHVDLLDPAPQPTHDLVVSIEVLEHIEDDVRALRTMFELSRRFVWVLVPFCDERALTDPAVRRAAWERHEHVRPGYTHAMLADRFAESEVLWRRNCYFQPDAEALRTRLTAMSTPRLVLERRALFAAAVRDIRAGRVRSGRDSQGVEVLATVGGTEGRPTVQPDRPTGS